MKKIKLIKIKTQALRGLTIQIDPSLYDRLNKISYDLKVSKKALINTGLEKILDDIETLGVEL
ncbi:hypothetical protein [Cetobacterium sp.]|uniref:hypothetical protein n=1 Tax=Cetobacterium sp. TaxID=2071632 RepID=UPI003EE5F01E